MDGKRLPSYLSFYVHVFIDCIHKICRCSKLRAKGVNVALDRLTQEIVLQGGAPGDPSHVPFAASPILNSSSRLFCFSLGFEGGS